jgi:hypothetical protein
VLPDTRFLVARKDNLQRNRFTSHSMSLYRPLSVHVCDIQHPQAAKDVTAGHDMLLKIFKSIKRFLERLTIYNNIPLTTGMVELLRNIMAQVLSVLAISTKAMAECRTSEPNYLICVH